jgi:hypothetical protein
MPKEVDFPQRGRGQTPVTVDTPLTTKQRAFVRELAKGESVKTAAVRAGYSHGESGYRVVEQPNIRRALDIEKKKFEESAGMTRKKVMDGLLEGIEMAKLMAEPGAIISGWREIGKMCGYYEPVQKKIDLNITGNVVFERLNRLSDQDLLKLIAQEGGNLLEQEIHDDDSDEDE